VTRHLRRLAPLALGVGTVSLLSSCASSFGIPDGATEQGQDVNDLWGQFFVTSMFVGGITLGLILIAIVVFRRRRGDDAWPKQSEGNVPLEVVYTAIPVAIVIGLWSISTMTVDRVLDVAPDPDVQVNVEAFAWGWRFAYPDDDVEVVSAPDTDGPQMVLPVGRTTRIRLTSDDVIHSFYVPDFLFKRDAIPGRTWEFDLTPTETGVFEGACAEFCGLDHAYMRFSVRVVQPAEFERWLQQTSATQSEVAA
jgi:cytochrome c oxidase subunit II